MKKFMLLLLSVFCISTMFAMQEPSESIEVTFSAIKSIFLPGIVSMLLVLFADAKRYFLSEEWSWKIFFTTKIKPFLLTTVGGVVLYVLLGYVPFLQPFVEILTESELTEITSAAFFGAAVAIVDGFTKKKDETVF